MTPCEIQLPASGIDILTNRILAGKMTIDGFEVLVIDSQSPAAPGEEQAD